jgi:rifampicin phosphotransferase
MTRDLAMRESTGGLITLDDPACEASALVGNKAATLSVLRRDGFQVPPGLVVSTDALAPTDNKLPAAISAALKTVAERLGPGPWAVRSSSTAEDSQQASFAGQFETVLNVDPQGLEEAVLRCRQSGSAERVAVYRGDKHAGSMAVLIQPMIAADAAGVAFTADPVSGKHDIVIEAVAGLGERLVSGTATPERWMAREDGSIQAPPSATVLDQDKAKAVSELARKVEQRQGRPQDIEWAIAGGSLWLLQARPITVLPSVRLEPIPIEVPPGVWVNTTTHWPVPQSQFGMVIITEQLLKAIPVACAELGLMIDHVEHRSIGGWSYSQLTPVGAPSPRRGGPPGPPPRWVLALLMRLHPAIRRRSSAARKALESDLPATVIRRWYDEWRPEHQEDARRALALDLGSLSDPELLAELDHRIQVLGHPAHAMVGFACFIVEYELASACRELLGWDTARMITLLQGLSTASSEPGRQLGRLVELARRKLAVRALLARVDPTTPSRLGDVDAEFALEFTRYVDATGHRSVSRDVMDYNLAEAPHLMLQLVADQLDGGFSPDETARTAHRRRDQAADEARSLLASRPAADRERFERALTRGREAYPAFEDRVWHTTSVQTALLRYLALEIGRRLADRGQLESREDVFFLEVGEARSALLARSDQRETVRKRKGQRAWAIANPGPPMYGDLPPGDPPFDLLPPAARFVNQGFAWGWAQFLGQPVHEHGASLVSGTPASTGRYTGTVRVVMNEHQFGKIQAGDVVVCPMTQPAWSIVFPNLGALVTDAGGMLSHPAIIAREHGIPAVVGTGDATKVLKDGQRVTVDGTRGIVELASSARRE